MPEGLSSTAQTGSAPEEIVQITRGHNYGDIHIEGATNVHLGDNHFYSERRVVEFDQSNGRASEMTVGSAVQRIKESYRDLDNILVVGKLATDHPSFFADLSVELTSLDSIIRGLDLFLQRTDSVSPARSELIPVQDIIVIMSQIVIVHSELQILLQKWHRWLQIKGWIDTIRTAVTVAALGLPRLLQQLQRHKSSLALILQIISCGSQLEALKLADDLRDYTDKQLEQNPDLAHDIQGVQVPQSSIIRDDAASITTVKADRSALEIPLAMLQKSGITSTEYTSMDYSEALRLSKVYKRVQAFEVDAVSSLSSTRSHGWSMLSGISCSRISAISVIRLPNHDGGVETHANAGAEQARISYWLSLIEEAVGEHAMDFLLTEYDRSQAGPIWDTEGYDTPRAVSPISTVRALHEEELRERELCMIYKEALRKLRERELRK